jgi:HrpA-like RNA helicase
VSLQDVLEEMWTSKANCRQRKGRAGRVREGICYHLVSKFTMDRLPDYMTPEMLKMSLEDTILQVRGHFPTLAYAAGLRLVW